MRRGALLCAVVLLAPAPGRAQERAVPYWASIAASEAMMRAGPDRSYPALWVYRRRDLPLKVEQIVGPWRRVREQDGTTGWMLAMLLSARRTGVVSGGLQPILSEPGGGLLWQAEAGVVGRLSRCDGRWCRIQIGERAGYIAEDGVWGVEPGETFR